MQLMRVGLFIVKICLEHESSHQNTLMLLVKVKGQVSQSQACQPSGVVKMQPRSLANYLIHFYSS